MVQGGGRLGLAMEAGQVRSVVDAVGGQHLDRHPPLHEHVLGQVDPAHAAGAQVAQQLVLAEEEAAMAAFQQTFGLPAGNQPRLDQVIGDPIRVGQGGRPDPSA